MFNWEIFWSVMLAILAAKFIGYVVQVATIGSVQNSLKQLNMKLGKLGSEFEQHISVLRGGLVSKLASIDEELSKRIAFGVNEIRNNTRDIKQSLKYSR